MSFSPSPSPPPPPLRFSRHAQWSAKGAQGFDKYLFKTLQKYKKQLFLIFAAKLLVAIYNLSNSLPIS